MSHDKFQKRQILLDKMIEEMDDNHNQKIERAEFQNYFRNQLSDKKSDKMIDEIWELYDDQHSDVLDIKQARSLLKDLLKKSKIISNNKNILQNMILEMDGNANGKIEKKEFHEFFNKYFSI